MTVRQEEEDVSSYWMTLRKREGTEKLKEGTLDCSVWKTRFGKGARQTTESVNVHNT